MMTSNLFFIQVALIGVVVFTTVVDATEVGGVCEITQDCTNSGSGCLGGFCCDPAHDATDALACASGTGIPLFALVTVEPETESSILDTIIDNWYIAAGAGGGLLFGLTVLCILRCRRKRRMRNRKKQQQHLASQTLPTHERRSHDAKIKPPTAHHQMAASGTLRRKASDLMSIITSSRGQGMSTHTSASSASTVSGSFPGHSRKMSRFQSTHTLIDPEVFQSNGSLQRNPSCQSMNPNFETVAPPPGIVPLGGSRWRMRTGTTLSRTGSTLSRTGSTLKRTGSNMKRKMGSFESLGSFASSIGESTSNTVSYFGRHLTRVQSRMQNTTRSRFGSFIGSSGDLSTPPTPPPRRPTNPPRRPTAGPPPGLVSGMSSAHSSRSRADDVPMPIELMPSALVGSNRDLMRPPPGMDSYSGSQLIPPPPPPPPPAMSAMSFSGELNDYV